MAGPRSKPFRKDYPIGTKMYYSSGTKHAAYDYLTPMGTAVLAVRQGKILDMHYGESDNPPRRYSGMPSNWILLGYLNDRGEQRTIFYNHLRQGGIEVRRGQAVSAGQLIAYSGNSGNSTGPHTHIAAMKGWRYGSQRYLYLSDPSTLIFPPDLCWAPTSL